MSTYVALLYSISLPDKRRLIMSDLRDLATRLEFHNPRTVLATGNLIFETLKPIATSTLTAKLETAFQETFGRQVDIIVITADQLRAINAANPFPAESQENPSHVIVRVMRNPITPDVLAKLKLLIANGEKIESATGHLWLYFANNIAGSRLGAALTPAKAGGPGTCRNWNTLRKIEAAL